MAAHGTITRYKSGCTCTPCRRINTERQRLYREGHRFRVLVPAEPARRTARDLVTLRDGEEFRWTYESLSRHIKMDQRAFSRMIRGNNVRINREFAERLAATPRRDVLVSRPVTVPVDAAAAHLKYLCTKVADETVWTTRQVAFGLGVSRHMVQLIMRKNVPGIEKDLEEKILALPTRGRVVGLGFHVDARSHAKWLCTKRPGGDYWTQRDLAAEMGVTLNYLSKWVRGKRRVPRSFADRVMGIPNRGAYLKLQENRLTRLAS